MTSARRSAPAVARNTAPILEVLREVLPAQGSVVEVASGTGEHALAFARAFPDLLFQPTDPDPDALRSTAAWREEAGLPNLLPPLRLDASTEDWPVAQADAVLCINMVHISPWAATLGLMRGAERVLSQDGVLYLYGPYLQRRVETAPSNLAFDADLKRRNPDWGLRRLEEVVVQAEARGLHLDRVMPMPANNLSVVFRKG